MILIQALTCLILHFEFFIYENNDSLSTGLSKKETDLGYTETENDHSVQQFSGQMTLLVNRCQSHTL